MGSLSVANILLEVTGESAEARRELADVARDLALFGREEAEAVAYVETTEAQAALDDLKHELSRLSAEDYTAEVNLRIAKAMADAKALEAELERLDREDVEVDVDVKRGVIEQVGALSRLVAELGEETQAVSSGGLRNFIRSVLDADIGVGRWSTSLANILRIGPLVVAVIVALVGQLVAMVASLANAAAGVGVLGIAFGAALVPGILLAIGAVARFKEQSETAGTAAHALRESVGGLVDSFKSATAGGADAVFRGIGDAVRDLDPLIDSLGPAFTRLGKAGGDAFRMLGAQFSSPEWRKFFVFTTDSLAKLTPLFARSFGAFSEILRNIATAAMPFLIQGIRAIARGLEAIADKTSDIRGLRGSIGEMMDSLKAWGHLLGGIVDLAGAFVKAFAPIGDSIVASLGDGAHNLAEWLRSSEGLRKVKQFFEDTGPLAAEVAKLILNIGLALVQIGQFVAPALAPIVRGFNEIVGVLNKVLSWLNDHVSRGFREALGTIASFIGGLGKVGKAGEGLSVVLRLLAGLAGALGGALGNVGGAVADGFAAAVDAAQSAGSSILGTVRDIWSKAKGVFGVAIEFLFRAPRDVLGVVRDIWRAAKGIITDAIKFLFQAPRDVLGPVREVWRAAKGIVNDVIEFFLKVPHDAAGAARDLWQDVKGVVTDGIEFVLRLPGTIVAAARDLWNKVKAAVSGVIDLVVQIVPDFDGLPGKVKDALGFAEGFENLRESMFALVGERGPELAFLPQGTDIYDAGETRNILKALARGTAQPAGSGARPAAPSTGGGDNYYDVRIEAPSSGYADPDIAAALWNAKLRARGALPA